MKMSPEKLENFWSKVNFSPKLGPKKDCWEWAAGSKNKEGYGGFWITEIKNTVNCHKISFMLAHNFNIGDIPEGIVVRHKCNNYKCVKPSHLMIGTYKDNSQDMVKAGNSLKGLKNPKYKVTTEISDEVRKLWKTGEYTYEMLCDKYDLSNSTISAIVKNRVNPDPQYDPQKYSKQTKVSDKDIETIKELKKQGLTVKEIKKLYPLGETQIYNILGGRQRRK